MNDSVDEYAEGLSDNFSTTKGVTSPGSEIPAAPQRNARFSYIHFERLFGKICNNGRHPQEIVMDSRGVLRWISVPVCAGVAMSLLAGCASTISQQQLDQMSGRSYTALLANASNKGVLNTDEALTARVRAVASRVIPKTTMFGADAPALKWEVNVVDRNELDAYCLPGGQIVFNSGIIRGLVLSDNEIAVVMGHMMAHVLRAHLRGELLHALAGEVGADDTPRGSGVAGTSYRQLLPRRFSITDEADADRMGLELVARAGFDPSAAVTLWNKLIYADQEEQQAPEFLAAHPAGANRIEQIQALLPELMPLYPHAAK
jgi:predicted Zn-dependent protease